MAYDYDKIKQQYEALSPEKQQQFANMMKNDTSGNYADFMSRYNAEKNQTSTPVSNQTTNNTTVVKPEYQGTGNYNSKNSSYTNQGGGNYVYNPTTGYYEKQSTSQTSTPVSSNNSIVNSVRDAWNAKSYEEQQELLKNNPNMQATLTKYGITNKGQQTPIGTKTSPYTNQGEGQYVYNPKTGYYEKKGVTQGGTQGWDYQSDSPERMAEIAANLEGYKQTMPYLFNDKRAFDDFFINGKGRSQAQIDFLNQWFENNRKYGKYDALTPDSIGYGIAYGDIPEDYLTMLKTTDPAKYQAVLQAKQDAEDKIKDKTALDTTSALSGESEATITSKAIEWLKSQGLFLDKDGNLIDDRTENYATDEEKQYAKDAADIIARNLDIDNTVKHTYDDLVKAYPGATKATLMAMAQDTNSDLLREKENNNVELTRLQGYMDYMQSERQERNRIGENAIEQLQKQYGMYYQYTPQGMSELAQAQYAATNVTLDQADNGTDTQKQMALQSVLDDYYNKYGSIIQRSEQQVINDVMAYAKKNGIGLAQALQENFIKPLKEKPQFATLSSGGTLGGAGTDKWTDIKIKDDKGNEITVKMNQSTGEVANMDGTPYTGKIQTTAAGGAAFIPVSKAALSSALSKTQSQYGVGSKYKDGWCGQIVNLYLQNAGSNIQLGDDISTKTKWITNDNPNSTPNVGDVVVWDMSKNPKASDVAKESGHVAIVTKVYDDGSFDVYQQNGHGNHTVSADHITSRNYIAGFIDPTAVQGGDNSNYDYSDYETGILSLIPVQLKNTEGEKKIIMDKIKSYYDRGMSQLDGALIQMGFNVQNATAEGKGVAQDILRTLSYVADPDAFDETFMFMLANDVNNGRYTDAIDKAENQVYKFIAKSGNNAISRTDMGDVAVAISSLNKYKNNGNRFQNVELSLEDVIGAEGKNVGKFDIWQANLVNALEGLGYSEENALQMVPSLKNARSTFIGKMETLQNLLLDKYNKQRAQYGMPPVTLAVLLGNQSILTSYGLNAEGEALQTF